MRVSDAFVDFLASWEGERLVAYQVPGEHFWTIGVGHTGKVKGVLPHHGMTISRDLSRQLLKEDLKAVEATVNRMVPLRWRRRRRRFETLVSLVFNMGPEILTASAPLISVGQVLQRRVTTTTIKQGAAAIQLYNKGGQPLRVMPGLVRRRSAEAHLFTTGKYIHNH
jgi:lysozyme